MMKKKNVKRAIILLSFFMLLLISIILVVKIINNYENKNINRRYNLHEKLSEEEMKDYTEKVDKYLENRIIPSGIYKFSSNYNGELTREILYKKLNYIIKFIPDLYKETFDMDNKELNDYFIQNKNIINQYLGITEYNKFKEFQEYIKLFDFNNEYKNCKIIDNSFENSESYLKFNLDIILENDITIGIKIQFANKKDISPIIIVDCK